MNENVRVCREVPTNVSVNPATSTLSPLFFSNVGIRLSDYDASHLRRPYLHTSTSTVHLLKTCNRTKLGPCWCRYHLESSHDIHFDITHGRKCKITYKMDSSA